MNRSSGLALSATWPRTRRAGGSHVGPHPPRRLACQASPSDQSEIPRLPPPPQPRRGARPPPATRAARPRGATPSPRPERRPSARGSREVLPNRPNKTQPACQRTNPLYANPFRRLTPLDLRRPDGAKCAGSRPWGTLGLPGTGLLRVVPEVTPPPRRQKGLGKRAGDASTTHDRLPSALYLLPTSRIRFATLVAEAAAGPVSVASVFALVAGDRATTSRPGTRLAAAP
jgi:hypothetical protein